MNNVKDYILEISRVENESSIHVMEALLGAYGKMFMIENNYDGEDDNMYSFTIFQEGKIMDDVKEQGKDMGTVGKIISLLPRLIISLYRAITGKLDKNLGPISSSTHDKKKKKLDAKKVAKIAGSYGLSVAVVGGVIFVRKKISQRKTKGSSSKDASEYEFKIDSDGNVAYIGTFKIELLNECLDKLSEKLKRSLSDPKYVEPKFDVNQAAVFVNEGEKESDKFSKDIPTLIKEYNKADQKIKKISEDFKKLSDTFKKYTESQTDDEKRSDDYLKYKNHVEAIATSINGAIDFLGGFRQSLEAMEKIVDDSAMDSNNVSDNDTVASSNVKDSAPVNADDNESKNTPEEVKPKPEEDKPKPESKPKPEEDKPKPEEFVNVPTSVIYTNIGKWITKGLSELSKIKNIMTDDNYNPLVKAYEKTMTELSEEDIDEEDAVDMISNALEKYLYDTSKYSIDDFGKIQKFFESLGYEKVTVKPGAKCKKVGKYFDAAFEISKGATPENNHTVQAIDNPPYIINMGIKNRRGFNDTCQGIIRGSMTFYKVKK